MKIKLLKALPWYDVGHTFEQEPGWCVWYTLYLPDELINTGWAEEVEAPKTVWDLEEGDEYIFLDNHGDTFKSTWDGVIVDKRRRKNNNCFLTWEDAEMELLRRESRAKAWKPDMGQNFWTLDRMGSPTKVIWGDLCSNFLSFHNGNTYKTREEAIEWKKTYGKAFGLT